MLILTRRVGESILIDNPPTNSPQVGATGLHVLAQDGGEPITVTVLGVKGNQIRIGIDAPTDITILREELVPSGVHNVNTGEARQS